MSEKGIEEKNCGIARLYLHFLLSTLSLFTTVAHLDTFLSELAIPVFLYHSSHMTVIYSVKEHEILFLWSFLGPSINIFKYLYIMRLSVFKITLASLKTDWCFVFDV